MFVIPRSYNKVEMISQYHALYYAHLLSQKAIGGGLDTISQSLLSATVDINPHQIDAALFAFKSPLSKGVVLADEVGLGKTIEAGLVICQYWALGKRKQIVICPASLRKQWSFELTEKFGIDNEILDTQKYNEYIRLGKNPLNQGKLIICSYNFVARKKEEILMHGFDIAIIDEAHKLRNVYRKTNKTSNAVREALIGVKKILLTATPFQNSLMELYGLTSVIDENIFGNDKSFRAIYGDGEHNADLRDRLQSIYKRTLRKDVKEYINYTNRLPLTQKFDSTDEEFELYTQISDFLRRTDIYSVPRQQAKLTTMIIRKILASSTFALIGTLTNIKARLERMLVKEQREEFEIGDLFEDDEDFNEVIGDNEYEYDIDAEEAAAEAIDVEALKAEIEELQGFIDKASSIKSDSKSYALLSALEKSFQMQARNGAPKKALIFTESIRTQAYLNDFLSKNGYSGRIVLFNGRASDTVSNSIYTNWCDNNPNKVSGIKAADRRAAIVDYFKNEADIMIATEAAAEGLNLQFCSLVINYDLPWNPQRIEQRIGRCHRYGQKFDVVVVNFVNIRNYADVRVFSLLEDKFNLFDDIFGASDEVLGQADAIDFETRIWEIYQKCRTEDEINYAFEKLQEDMQIEINQKMRDTRLQVLENFDINVQEHLKIAKSETGAFLNRYEHIFWELTKYILGKRATFDDKHHSFFLNTPVAGAACKKYDLLSELRDGTPYRLSHPLAQYVIQEALKINPGEDNEVVFDKDALAINVLLPDSILGQSGYLALSKLSIASFDEEQYSLFTAFTDDGQFLSQEECEKMFLYGGRESSGHHIDDIVLSRLNTNTRKHSQSKIREIDSRNLKYFKDEENRIYRWEKDVIEGIEKELDTIKRNIREAERLARSACNVSEQVEYEKRAEELRRQKRRKRNELEDREDEVSAKRAEIIKSLESKMIQSTTIDSIFVIRWTIKE